MVKKVEESSRIGELVFIEWYDIVTDNGWRPIKDVIALDDMECWTVGWVIYEDKEIIQICSIRDPKGEKESNNRAAIPKGCVKSINKLETP